MRTWDSLVDSYIQILTQRGLGSSHINLNVNELYELGSFLKLVRPKVSISDVKSDHLLKYIQRRSSFKSKATTAGVISRVRCFGEYLVSQHVWPSNPLRWIKGPKLNSHRAISKSLNREHISRMYIECFKQPSTYSKFMSPAIFSLLYTTGMRKGELVLLDIDHWDEKEKAIKIFSPKTGLERFVPVNDVTARLIDAYIEKRTQVLFKYGHENEKALFVTNVGKRVVGGNLHSRFKKISIKAEVPVFSLHMLRHSCATDLIAAGVGIPQVQRVLGHACVQSTMRYTHVSDPQRTEAIKIHPINQILGVAT